MDFLMDFTSSGSSELGRDLQKNGPFFSAFWEFRAGRRPPEKCVFVHVLMLREQIKQRPLILFEIFFPYDLDMGLFSGAELVGIRSAAKS